MKKLIIYTFILVNIAACIPKPIPLEIPQADNKVVVFSQIIPNRVMIVSLTRSFSALDINLADGDSISQDFLNNLVEEDAEVTISYDSKTDTLFSAGLGIYFSLNTLQTLGSTYQLNVKTKQGEIIKSSTQILDKIQFDTVMPIIYRSTKDTMITVRLRFQDLLGTNFYMLNYYTKGSGGGLDFNSFFKNGTNILTRTDLISDLEMEKGIYAKTVELSGIKATDSLAVSVSNISKEYYEYLNQRKQSGKLLQQVFNEPINYRSNIINGYGFFNAYFPDLHLFDLKKY